MEKGAGYIILWYNVNVNVKECSPCSADVHNAPEPGPWVSARGLFLVYTVKLKGKKKGGLYFKTTVPVPPFIG